MKVYKKNIWTNAFWWLFLLQFAIPIIFILSGNVSHAIILLYFLFAIGLISIYGTASNYLIFTDNYFVVKNVVYPFFKTKLYYSDIRKIEFRRTPKDAIFLQIYMQHSNRIKRSVIECVKKKDLSEIAVLLKKKGIEVDDHILYA